jgi:hypothetical protein
MPSCFLSKNEEIKISRTIILPVVLYGFETWSLKVREEHRLRVLQNRVLRRMFGPKREEQTGSSRKHYNEELYNSPIIIRVIKLSRMIMGGACSTHGIYEKCIQYFGWKTLREELTRKT